MNIFHRILRMTIAFSPSSPEFGKLKAVAQQLVSHKQLNASLLVSLSGSLAAEANKMIGLSGSQKKQLVLDVVMSIVVSTDLSEEEKKQLVFVVEHVLPASLDLAVDAARGKFDLKKVKKSCFSSFLACLPFLVSAAGGSSQQAQLVVRTVESVAAKVDEDLVVTAPPAEPVVPVVEQSNPLVEKAEETKENIETLPPQTNPEVSEDKNVVQDTPATENQTA